MKTIKLIFTALVLSFMFSSSSYALGMRNAPCDGFMDCVYTAYWWAFLR